MDDGSASWAASVQPVLDKYGFKGNYGCNQDKALTDGDIYASILPSLRMLRTGGSEICSHTYHHYVVKETLWDELVKSKEQILKDVGGPCDVLHVPGGASQWNGKAIADCHDIFRIVRLTLPQTVSNGNIVPLLSTIPVASVGSTAVLESVVMKKLSCAFAHKQ